MRFANAKRFAQATLEGETIGMLNKEIEYTIYALIEDMSKLDKAPMIEEHEQWRIPLAKECAVKQRIRLINNRRYTQTTKLKEAGVEGFFEITSDIPKDLFEHLRLAAVDGYKKTRYTFPVQGTELKWEIDVFIDKMGKPHNWVKIDLEVKNLKDEIPPFPEGLKVGKYIIENENNTVEEERFIKKLWSEEWSKLDSEVVSTAAK